MLEAIRTFLRERAVSFREVHHQPTFTSEQSAQARGESVTIGGKALLIKVEDAFKLFVLSAERKLDSKALKARFAVKNIRFATREELQELTGLVPGSVPPFGRPLLDFDLYVDDSVFANELIAFNAGSVTDSIVMAVTEYARVTPHERFTFSRK